MCFVSHRLGLLAVFAIFTLSACETTGDPRSGGLFGWSEEKARQRQESMEQDAALARRNVDEERLQQVILMQKQSQLRSEIRALQTRLDKLLKDNGLIEESARKLLVTRKNSTVELSRLQQMLDASTRACAEARRIARLPATPRQVEVLSRQSDVVRQYNQQLHREVMLLARR